MAGHQTGLLALQGSRHHVEFAVGSDEASRLLLTAVMSRVRKQAQAVATAAAP